MRRRKISVILTTFNGSKYIEKQLESILNQTVQPDEIIICDDRSTDKTVFLLNKYLVNNKIKLFVNEKQLGVVENFKQAAKLALNGNWIVFSDQDDIWALQKLRRLIDEMKLIDDYVTPTLIYSDLSVIDKNDEIIANSFWKKQKIKPGKVNFTRLLYGNVVTGCTMIINYPMAEEFFNMDKGNYLHDEWLALIAYSFGKVKFLNERLVLYRTHENNITFSQNNKAPGVIELIKEDLDHLLGKCEFLPRQFDLAQEFLLKYSEKLDSKNKEIIEKFIKLKNKSYLVKRITRRFTYL
jgi:glycosyltransferase involved in cell wall biosynthesis